MSDFHIWGRVEHVGPSQFLAIATAIRADASSDGLDVLHEIASSRETAEVLLKEAMVTLGKRVRLLGHRVIDVDADGI